MQGQVAIFMYHAVVRSAIGEACFITESVFRDEIRCIRDNFDVIPLTEVVRRLSAGESFGPTAAITFDDGFQNNYESAFPILREAALPATLFLTTQFLNTDKTFWYGLWIHAIRSTQCKSMIWNGQTFDLQSPRAKRRSSDMIQDELKKLPQTSLLRELAKLVQKLTGKTNFTIRKRSPVRMLDVAAINEMVDSGLVEFGAHTYSHAILSKIPNAQKREEIVKSIEDVQQFTGRCCRLFAYPNGRHSDYDSASMRILRENGIIAAVTAEPGINDKTTPHLELRRYPTGFSRKNQSFDRFVENIVAGQS
jgi:peptidoglycan/xylan/chitin deacetylase (PgdA/CDA1 family)